MGRGTEGGGGRAGRRQGGGKGRRRLPGLAAAAGSPSRTRVREAAAHSAAAAGAEDDGGAGGGARQQLASAGRVTQLATRGPSRPLPTEAGVPQESKASPATQGKWRQPSGRWGVCHCRRNPLWGTRSAPAHADGAPPLRLAPSHNRHAVGCGRDTNRHRRHNRHLHRVENIPAGGRGRPTCPQCRPTNHLERVGYAADTLEKGQRSTAAEPHIPAVQIGTGSVGRHGYGRRAVECNNAVQTGDSTIASIRSTLVHVVP